MQELFLALYKSTRHDSSTALDRDAVARGRIRTTHYNPPPVLQEVSVADGDWYRVDCLQADAAILLWGSVGGLCCVRTITTGVQSVTDVVNMVGGILGSASSVGFRMKAAVVARAIGARPLIN